MKSMINVENVGHSFQSKVVLEHIKLDIKKGEIIGLLGPSGAGKTTLINILTGQIAPMSGTVSIQGNDITKNKNFIDRVGIMMDSFGLYERLSVYDNLKIFASIYQVPLSRIDELLERVELGDARKTPVSKLSKGMCSRVNFCRALLKEIDILFLDEPTSGLDPATMKKIHELIMEEKNKGVTIFLTTHNMFEAETLCDHVALLNQGRIIEYGEPKEICNKYNYLNKIHMELKDGRKIDLANEKNSALLIKDFFEQEMIVTIHSTEPNLENVFLELTGRGLSI